MIPHPARLPVNLTHHHGSFVAELDNVTNIDMDMESPTTAYARTFTSLYKFGCWLTTLCFLYLLTSFLDFLDFLLFNIICWNPIFFGHTYFDVWISLRVLLWFWPFLLWWKKMVSWVTLAFLIIRGIPIFWIFGLKFEHSLRQSSDANSIYSSSA